MFKVSLEGETWDDILKGIQNVLDGMKVVSIHQPVVEPGDHQQPREEPAKKAKAPAKAKAKAPDPVPEPEEDEAEAESPDLVAVKNAQLDRLRDLFSAGKVKFVRELLATYGGGAKVFPEVDATLFPAIKKAIDKELGA